MTGGHLPQVHFLRGIAALLVGFYHFSWFIGPHGNFFAEDHIVHRVGRYGMDGVYMFFVISGFVIPLSMKKGNYLFRKALRFIWKRSIRLEPPYIASIGLIIAVNVYLSHKWGLEYPISIKRILLHIGYLIPFTGGKYEWFNIIFWTLAIEFQYYLLMTILFPLLDSKYRMMRIGVLALFLAGPFISADITILPVFGPCFLLGFLLYLVSQDKISIYELIFFAVGDVIMNWYYRDVAVIVSTLFAFLFIWFVNTGPRFGKRLGDISYSFYLVHGIIGGNFLLFWYNPEGTVIARLGMLSLTMVICICCAFIFWFCFERPFKNISSRIRL